MPEGNRGRVRTDQSLRAERGKTDSELDKRRDAADRTADAVISRARHAADGILKTARDTADDERGDEPHDPGVLQNRTQADAAVKSARTGADEMVRREREERRRALDSLLLLEREETDQHLLTERGFSDEAVNTRDIFLAMVSHDLRTMLGGIALTAQLLARESAAASDTKAVVLRAESIQRLTARMNRLIGDEYSAGSGRWSAARARGSAWGFTSPDASSRPTAAGSGRRARPGRAARSSLRCRRPEPATQNPATAELARCRCSRRRSAASSRRPGSWRSSPASRGRSVRPHAALARPWNAAA
jgi:hypothetical protein